MIIEIGQSEAILLATALLGASASILKMMWGMRDKILQVEIHTNSMHDEIVKAAEMVARANGVETGRQQIYDEQDEQDA